jgi:hypothetical protein
MLKHEHLQECLDLSIALWLFLPQYVLGRYPLMPSSDELHGQPLQTELLLLKSQYVLPVGAL